MCFCSCIQFTTQLCKSLHEASTGSGIGFFMSEVFVGLQSQGSGCETTALNWNFFPCTLSVQVSGALCQNLAPHVSLQSVCEGHCPNEIGICEFKRLFMMRTLFQSLQVSASEALHPFVFHFRSKWVLPNVFFLSPQIIWSKPSCQQPKITV